LIDYICAIKNDAVFPLFRQFEKVCVEKIVHIAQTAHPMSELFI